MYALSQSYHIAFHVEEGFLYMTKQYFGSGEGYLHRARLAQDTVPLIYINPILIVGYGGEYLPVWGKGQCHVEFI